MNVEEFLATFLASAGAASRATGLDTSVILAQWADETAWGSSSAWVDGHNYAGVSPGGHIASYASPAAGLDAYIATMNGSPQFGPRVRTGATPSAQCELLGSAHPVWAASGYNNGAGPGSALIAIIEANDFEQYDTTAPPPASPTPPQIGELDMISTEVVTTPEGVDQLQVLVYDPDTKAVDQYWQNVGSPTWNGPIVVVPPAAAA